MILELCPHQDFNLVWVPIGDGQRRQLRKQCQQCGDLCDSAVPHSKASPDTPLWNVEAADRSKKILSEFYARRRQHSDAEFTERYAEYPDYLLTPQWKEIRRKVMTRANGTCEGCGEWPASEVHHLTYKHIFSEFLFELVAVCHYCHRLIHKEKDEIGQ